MIRLWSPEGEIEAETVANGQIITGASIQGKRDYFLASTVNEETGDNSVALYRKQKLVK